MNILAFDTFGKTCTVAVATDNTLIEKTSTNGLTHSVNLMPMIDEAVKEANLSINNIDIIAVVGGPGSFTGVRIGISCAKGLAHGLSIPVILLNTLDVLTAIDCPENTLICPILDARAMQVYTKAVLKTSKGFTEIIPDNASSLDAFLSKISSYENIVFTGDAVPIHQNYIKSKISHVIFSDMFFPNGSALISKAKENLYNAKHYTEILPIYLRAPQAERMLQNKKV